MRIKSNYSTYRIKKHVPSKNWLIFLCIYLFAGIQANLEFKMLGYFFNVNLLFILAAFLIIEFEWRSISIFCVLIGFVMDIFSNAQFGISTVSLWLSGFMIARIKRAFYIEYLSTTVFLLFLLILGYSFLISILHFITQGTLDFIRPFTHMVIYNSALTLLCVPFIYPLLLKALVHGKK